MVIYLDSSEDFGLGASEGTGTDAETAVADGAGAACTGAGMATAGMEA